MWHGYCLGFRYMHRVIWNAFCIPFHCEPVERPAPLCFKLIWVRSLSIFWYELITRPGLSEPTKCLYFYWARAFEHLCISLLQNKLWQQYPSKDFVGLSSLMSAYLQPPTWLLPTAAYCLAYHVYNLLSPSYLQESDNSLPLCMTACTWLFDRLSSPSSV